jgi:N-formylglutamate amidohydrolase
MTCEGYPPWAVLHIPHDSLVIPEDVRSSFLLPDLELEAELRRMTDHFTQALFAGRRGSAAVIRAPVSRLVVDVERFADDAEEPMAARGMGVLYEVTSHLTPLRGRAPPAEREALLRAWYHPHHDALEAAVAAALGGYGQCLIIDCHSFPEIALPYERAGPATVRPDICIGADDFHTSVALTEAFVTAFSQDGRTVRVNDPFAGALVPRSRYRRDPRVAAVMVEVNRRLYLNEADASPLPDFYETAAWVRRCCQSALRSP